MPHPSGHGQDVAFFKELPDVRFVVALACHLGFGADGKRQRRDLTIAVLLVGFKGYGAFPFLAAHIEELLGRERDKCNIPKEVDVVVASDGGLVGHPRKVGGQPVTEVL